MFWNCNSKLHAPVSNQIQLAMFRFSRAVFWLVWGLTYKLALIFCVHSSHRCSLRVTWNITVQLRISQACKNIQGLFTISKVIRYRYQVFFYHSLLFLIQCESVLIPRFSRYTRTFSLNLIDVRLIIQTSSSSKNCLIFRKVNLMVSRS